LEFIARNGFLPKICDAGKLKHLLLQCPTEEEREIARRFAHGNSTSDELTILNCIVGMLAEASNNDDWRRQAAPSTLADALTASIHTCFNAAYAYSRYSYAHELLGTGAWLGILLRGRPALMPEFAAHILMDALTRSPQTDDTSHVLRCHAERVSDATRLIRQARRVLEFGRPVIVKPRPVDTIMPLQAPKPKSSQSRSKPMP
jgi:hypothetical protein